MAGAESARSVWPSMGCGGLERLDNGGRSGMVPGIMDVVLLSRLQFALTIMFHYLFPPLTIGLGLLIVVFEFLHLRTKDAVWRAATVFWVKLFAVSFAVGVASGIVMEFQFGTNWANYSRFVGDVFGSALAAEGIFAFFLESGFLAVLVFGRNKVSKGFYFFSACMVFLGSVFSSVWIIIANSWQQTPAGSHIVQMMRPVLDADKNPVLDAAGKIVTEPWFINGEPVMRAEIVDFWGLVFNPSTINRLTHTWTGCMVMGGFFVLSICSYYILKNKHLDVAKRCFKIALVVALLGSLLAAITGDSNARMVAKHQPAKLAAFEGHFETGEGPTAIHVFGIPALTGEHIYLPLEIPGGLTMLVYREFPPETPVIGLDAFRPEDRPPVFIPFVAFHLMVGLGCLFILLTLLGVFFWWRGTIFQKRWLLWTFVFMILGSFAANELGWITAEVGRQPWVVHPEVMRDDAGNPVYDDEGYIKYATIDKPAPGGGTQGTMVAGLRTRDGVSQTVKSGDVLGSIILFGLIYTLLFFVWIFVLNTKIQHGPEVVIAEERDTSVGDFLDAASARVDHHETMTAGKDSEKSDP